MADDKTKAAEMPRHISRPLWQLVGAGWSQATGLPQSPQNFISSCSPAPQPLQMSWPAWPTPRSVGGSAPGSAHDSAAMQPSATGACAGWCAGDPDVTLLSLIADPQQQLQQLQQPPFLTSLRTSTNNAKRQQPQMPPAMMPIIIIIDSILLSQ